MRVGDGTPGPGRPAGSKNKATLAREIGLAEVLERTGYDPMEALIKEAQTTKDQALRIEIAKYVMPFCYRRLPELREEDEEGYGGRTVRLVID